METTPSLVVNPETAVPTRLFLNASNEFSSTELEIVIQNTTLTQFISPWLLMLIYIGCIVILAIVVQGLCSLNYKMEKKKIEKREKKEKENQKHEEDQGYKRTEAIYKPSMYVKSKTILSPEELDSPSKYLTVNDPKHRKRHTNIDSVLRFQGASFAGDLNMANQLTYEEKDNERSEIIRGNERQNYRADINYSSI